MCESMKMDVSCEALSMKEKHGLDKKRCMDHGKHQCMGHGKHQYGSWNYVKHEMSYEIWILVIYDMELYLHMYLYMDIVSID